MQENNDLTTIVANSESSAFAEQSNLVRRFVNFPGDAVVFSFDQRVLAVAAARICTPLTRKKKDTVSVSYKVDGG